MSLTLRRSVWGSLRSSSPFTSSLQPQKAIPDSDQDKEEMPSISRSMPFVRGKRANSALKNGIVMRRLPRTITMTAFDAEGRPPPPELDREVDLVGSLDFANESGRPYAVFESLHPQQDPKGCRSAFFVLPPKIKHLVYSFCFLAKHNKVTLSPHFATKAVFDDQYFASPWDVLDPVWGGLAASRDLRDELLTYFWTEYHFHVSINPFSGPKFSPLSHLWLPQNLGKVQYLTIEVDLTRFGGSALTYASCIGFECGKVERLVVNLIEGLQQRSDEVMMAELVILSRRYLGNRPVDGVYVLNEEVPWHPNDFVFLRDAVRELYGLVRRCRIAGFPFEYSRTLLEFLFSNDTSTARVTEPRDSAWPPLPLYEPPVCAPTALNAHSVVSYPQCDSKCTTTTRRSTCGTDKLPETSNLGYKPRIDSLLPSAAIEISSNPSEWELTLHHSTSFTEMYEHGVNESIQSLSTNDTFGKTGDDEKAHVESFPKSIAQDAREHAPKEHAQSHQSLLSSMRSSPNLMSRDSLQTINIASVLPRPEDSSIALTDKLRQHENVSLETICSKSLVSHTLCIELVSDSGPPTSSGSFQGVSQILNDPPTPTPPRRGLPPSMSVMNALNEQDPAFIRTMEALRLRDDAPVRPAVERTQIPLAPRPSLMEPGDRSFSRISTRSVNGAKKRYTSFFGRLRGHVGG